MVVGREGRVLAGAKAHAARATLGSHADRALAQLDGHARLAQLVDHRVKMVGAGALQRDVAAGGRHRAQKGAGLDAVRNHTVRHLGRMQRGETKLKNQFV